MVWFGDVDGSVNKAIWTSLPDDIATRDARTLGVKSHGPGAASRNYMPLATHPAPRNGGPNGGKRGSTGSLRSAQATVTLSMPPAAGGGVQWVVRRGRG